MIDKNITLNNGLNVTLTQIWDDMDEVILVMDANNNRLIAMVYDSLPDDFDDDYCEESFINKISGIVDDNNEVPNYLVIRHEDDSACTSSLIDTATTHEDALDIILDEYYNGDMAQMHYEYQGNDYWDENCYGVEIIQAI